MEALKNRMFPCINDECELRYSCARFSKKTELKEYVETGMNFYPWRTKKGEWKCLNEIKHEEDFGLST
jgi:hypothetical protein